MKTLLPLAGASLAATAATTVAVAAPWPTAAPKNAPPNIVLFYIDDMGHGDLTVTGAI